jgi:hypothetical protein
MTTRNLAFLESLVIALLAALAVGGIVLCAVTGNTTPETLTQIASVCLGALAGRHAGRLVQSEVDKEDAEGAGRGADRRGAGRGAEPPKSAA